MRIKELDALRGIAAVSVMLFHYTSFFREALQYNFSSKWDWNYGHYGVSLFFTISGFVIFLSIEKVGNVKEFLFRRFMRLYPVYWVCLLLSFFVILIGKSNLSIPTAKELICNFTMFQGLLYVRNVDGSYWSLLPELMFYIMISVLFKLKLLPKYSLIGYVWLFLMFVSLLKPSIIDILLNLKFGMYFLTGMCFYKIMSKRGGIENHIIIFICLVAVLIVKQNTERFIASALIFTVFYLFVYGYLTLLNKKILLFFGAISYPLYLLHQSIGFVIINYLKNKNISDILAIGIAFCSCICIAWIITVTIERPILKKVKEIYKLKTVQSNK
ncbi:MAG: acyltransferase [Prevotellaceae bacterium]|jgi:peptidoglycan/LPS O-acetylase OafA/YrhL|nr:acyltransferase [Prevotellaceae bacterium]